MYLPKHFEVTHLGSLHQLIEDHPLGTLVVQTSEGLDCQHLPFELDRETKPYGRLFGHIARANPLGRQQIQEAMVIFQGPDAYISPSWYAAKQETGKVVPTWNYTAVHAYGQLRLIDDEAWLIAFLRRFSVRHESNMPQPWQLEEAPADYIQKQLRAIVGLEFTITRLMGKWKTSQNKSETDQSRIIEALRGRNGPGDQAMADVMAAQLAERNVRH